jgi:hypothetical protein
MASVLGHATTVIGYVARVVSDPQSFLYAGDVFFLATLGLDRLATSGRDE